MLCSVNVLRLEKTIRKFCKMPSDIHEDFPAPFGNAFGVKNRAQSVYQPASGEKHVLFYPTSPAPSANSDDHRSWSSYATSSAAVAAATSSHASSNHRLPNNSNIEPIRMRKNEGPSEPTTVQVTRTVEPQTEPRYSFRIGIYGWRKRCLYFLILGLLVMVIVNLALTLWVLKVMEFSSEGMGQLRIVSGGLQLNGRAMVLDALIASSIRSRAGQPIVIESSRNLTLTTRNEDGILDNRIFLGHDRFECLANNFMVTDDRGRVLFSASRSEVVVGAEALRVSGEGGVVFDGSVQTPLVRAEPGHDLRLESPTRSLDLRAPVSINIESRAGDIKATSLKDIKLQSVAGEIRLESGSVMVPGIPTALPASRSSSTITGSSRPHEVYQLCVCTNGKLFLAPSHGICAVDEDSHICR